MKLTQIIGKKIAVHCKTEDEAKEVCRIMKRPDMAAKFKEYTNATVYGIPADSVLYGVIDYAKNDKYQIITAKSFIEANTEPKEDTSIDDMRKWLKKHSEVLNISGIALKIGEDKGNFHRFISGERSLTKLKLHKLQKVKINMSK